MLDLWHSRGKEIFGAIAGRAKMNALEKKACYSRMRKSCWPRRCAFDLALKCGAVGERTAAAAAAPRTSCCAMTRSGQEAVQQINAARADE